MTPAGLNNKSDYVTQVDSIQHPEGFKNHGIGSKFKEVLLYWANKLFSQDTNFCFGKPVYFG